MDIVRVDPDDTATLARFAEVHRVAMLAGDPHAAPYAHDEFAALLRNLDPAERFTGYVGRIDGSVVAAGMTVTPQLDNVDQAGVEIWVEPALRRRRYGSILADDLMTRVAAEGRTTLITHVDYPLDEDESHPHRAFAISRGFTMANAEVHRVLALPVDSATLDSLIAESARHHSGYTFAEFAGPLPAEIMPAYCELLNALFLDAPTGDIDFEEGAVTPGDFAKRLESLAEQGRTLYTSVAFDADGSPAANSELVVPAKDPGKIFQWSTLVRRTHRGHRLGLATKARNLRWVQSLHPEREAVHTWNAESNTHMIAVNERLGFVPVGYNSAYQRKL